MPEAFDKCVREGGRVRRKTLSGGRYINICFDKAGKSHAGEVKRKKVSSMARNRPNLGNAGNSGY